MLRCEAIAAHMLKPAEVAAEFFKQQPQFAETGGIGHDGSRIGIYVAARASACPGREEAGPFEAAGKPFPV
jgi:hypothetical protein